MNGVVRLCTATPFVTVVSERPIACPLARYPSKNRDMLTTRNHRSIKLDKATPHLIGMLDGTRTLERLLDSFAWSFSGLNVGEFSIEKTFDKATPELIDDATSGGPHDGKDLAIDSFSWGARLDTNMSTSESEADAFTFSRPVDLATPGLFSLAATGNTVTPVTITKKILVDGKLVTNAEWTLYQRFPM